MLFHAMPVPFQVRTSEDWEQKNRTERKWTELEQPIQLCQNISIYRKKNENIWKELRICTMKDSGEE